MKHKTLIITLISALLLMMVASAVTAEGFEPYSSGANSVTVSFKLSDGVATVIGNTTSLTTGNSVKTTVYIQRKVGTTWQTVTTGNGGTEASASCSVVSGEIYRGRAVGKIFNSEGTQVDELAKNSASKEAP